MGLIFFGIDLELNFACYKINLIFLLCVEPYSRPLEKCFVTPGTYNWCDENTRSSFALQSISFEANHSDAMI